MTEKKRSEISRWDPFRDLDLLRGRSLNFDSPLWMSGGGAEPRWAPALDVSESDDQFTVTVELAGAKKEDVQVEVHDNVITIRGEKRNEREEEDEQRRFVERTYGSFSRSFTLPANADGDRVQASFKDGVLTVEIAKREEAKPNVIAVK